jgi:hypothetical protein
MKIIEAQVKDRSLNNGEWSKYVVGENGVTKISRAHGYADQLEIYFGSEKKLTFSNIPFFTTEN